MKKSVLTGVILTTTLWSSLSPAADWTPVFKSSFGEYIEGLESNDQGALAGKVLGTNWFIDSDYGRTPMKINKNGKNARLGRYPKSIPLPYRNDMLPAKAKASAAKHDGASASITIPLKNATVFGYKITNISQASGYEYGGTTVEFAPMTDAQYRQLINRFKIKREYRADLEENHGCGNWAEFKKEGKKVIFKSWGGC